MKQKINTKMLGEVEVDSVQLIKFSEPLFGFDNSYNYYLIDMDDNGIFKVLQSEEDEKLSFIVISPFLVFSEYTPNIHNSDTSDLGIKTEDEALLYVIVTIPQDMKEMSVNLLGPIIINKNNNKAKQCIVQNDNYTTKHPILNSNTDKA